MNLIYTIILIVMITIDVLNLGWKIDMSTETIQHACVQDHH